MPNLRKIDLMLKVVCLSLLDWSNTMEASFSTPGELVFTQSCFGLIYCFRKILLQFSKRNMGFY